MCREEKIISTSQQGCAIAVKSLFSTKKKNEEAATGGAEAGTGGVFTEHNAVC